jgi:hypothetical protein
MMIKEYGDANLWFWPIFYLGIGFAQAAVVVLVGYFVHAIRRRISDKTMGRVMGEMLIVLLSLPGFASIFSIVASMRMIHGTDYPASVVLGVAVSAATVALAYFLRPNAGSLNQ